MATLNDINITRSAGKRPTGNSDYYNHTWFVDKGQTYDAIKFSIKELKGVWWDRTLCVREGYPENRCRELANIFAKHITEKQIKEAEDMWEDFRLYGCD